MLLSLACYLKCLHHSFFLSPFKILFLIWLNLSCAQQQFCFKYSTLKVFLKSTKFKLVLIEFQLSKISMGLGGKWQIHLLPLRRKVLFLYIAVFLFLTTPMELSCNLTSELQSRGEPAPHEKRRPWNSPSIVPTPPLWTQ